MMPKKMIAKNSIAAVGARSLMPSVIMSLMPRPAPAKRPKATGTRISATTGVARLVMISTMKVATIPSPRATNIVLLDSAADVRATTSVVTSEVLGVTGITVTLGRISSVSRFSR